MIIFEPGKKPQLETHQEWERSVNTFIDAVTGAEGK